MRNIYRICPRSNEASSRKKKEFLDLIGAYYYKSSKLSLWMSIHRCDPDDHSKVLSRNVFHRYYNILLDGGNIFETVTFQALLEPWELANVCPSYKGATKLQPISTSSKPL
ncbi:hypothetical protein NPIL_578881 [Nephila pilipes]|uniref:Uncharacterized protein n=1 Tax=Nephila pilipes TaxID=299642 RepID=A0A8X6MXA5_NEPPI|nr:hypothetical protein NPIL_578881 [Nephila pilipes]